MMRVLFAVLINALLAFGSLCAQTPKRITRLPSQLTEVSGMYIAGPDSIWWLNDGGNVPALYLTNRRGRIKQTLTLPLPNRDWEELCADNQGNLYIGDFGNNANQRRDLCIFKVHLASMQIDSIRFSYADQTAWPPPTPDEKRFDCEAMIWHEGKLHLFTKCHYDARTFMAGYYILPDQPGTFIAYRRCHIPMEKQVITGASLSADGNTLALISYLFKKRGKLYFGTSYLSLLSWPELLNNRVQFQEKRRIRGWITARQTESIGFLRHGMLWIASERTPLHRPITKRLRL